jgi:hypothetical protein
MIWELGWMRACGERGWGGGEGWGVEAALGRGRAGGPCEHSRPRKPSACHSGCRSFAMEAVCCAVQVSWRSWWTAAAATRSARRVGGGESSRCDLARGWSLGLLCSGELHGRPSAHFTRPNRLLAGRRASNSKRVPRQSEPVRPFPACAFVGVQALSQLVERRGSARTIVFCNKIESCRDVENHLRRQDPGQAKYRWSWV